MHKRSNKAFRRKLNKKAFPSEVWFEKELKKKDITNYQKNYCLEETFFGDFVFVAKRIVIEIDGSSHKGKEDYDQRRDVFLESRGWTVIRIKFPAPIAVIHRFFADWQHKLLPVGTKRQRKQIRRNQHIAALTDLARRQKDFQEGLKKRRKAWRRASAI